MIECFCAPTPNSRRVTMTLEEAGLRYIRRPIDLTKREQRGRAFLALNPAGAVPVIRDPDGPDGQPLLLTQSAAICLYLAEKADKLLPKDHAKRAIALQHFAFAVTDLGGAASAIYRLSLTETAASPALAQAHGRLIFFARLLDQHLRSRHFIGDDIAISDIAVYSVLVSPFVEQVLEGQDLEHLRNWAARMAARPAIIRGL